MRNIFRYKILFFAAAISVYGCGREEFDPTPLCDVPVRLNVASGTTGTPTRASEAIDSTVRPGDDNGRGGTYGAADFVPFLSSDVAVWCALYDLPSLPVRYSSDFFMENVIFRYYDIDGGLFASSSSNAYWRLDKGHNFYVCQPVPEVVEEYKIPFAVEEYGIGGETNPEFSYARMTGVEYDVDNPNLDVYLIPQFARIDVNVQTASTVGDPTAYQVFGVRVLIKSSAVFNLLTGGWEMGDGERWITSKVHTDCENPEELISDYVVSIFPNTLSFADTPAFEAVYGLQININNVWYEVSNLLTSSGGIIPFSPGFITTLTVTINKTNATYNNLMVNFTGWHQENNYNGVLE